MPLCLPANHGRWGALVVKHAPAGSSSLPSPQDLFPYSVGLARGPVPQVFHGHGFLLASGGLPRLPVPQVFVLPRLLVPQVFVIPRLPVPQVFVIPTLVSTQPVPQVLLRC